MPGPVLALNDRAGLGFSFLAGKRIAGCAIGIHVLREPSRTPGRSPLEPASTLLSLLRYPGARVRRRDLSHDMNPTVEPGRRAHEMIESSGDD